MAAVLLIDDSEHARLVLGALLEDEGFAVTCAESCAAARALLGNGPAFDVVLVDYELGDGLGTELLPALRSALPHTKLVMLSGTEADEARGAGLGADAWIIKGGDPMALLSAIRGYGATSGVESP